MKRIISLILVVVLCLALSVSAFAANSDQGGAPDGSSKAPKTGSVALAALAVTACTAGAVSIVTGNKSK